MFGFNLFFCLIYCIVIAMIFLLLFVFVLLLLKPEIAAECVVSTGRLWFYKLVPVLYPNFILVDFLTESHALSYCGTLLFKPLKKIAHIRFPKSSVILILSFICGAPASTKLIRNALEEGDIDEQEANALLLSSSCFSLPYSLYVLRLFQLNKILYFLLVFFSCILILWTFNRGVPQTEYKKREDNKSFTSVFFSSVSKNIDILLSILGIMIFFNILLSLIHMDFRLYSYFEVLNGHNLLAQSDISKRVKDFLLISSLSFLGISVHLQVLYVYPKLNYVQFFSVKLAQALFIGLVFVGISILLHQ